MESLREYCKANLPALCKAILANPNQPEVSAVWYMAMAHAPASSRDAVSPTYLVEDLVKDLAMNEMAKTAPAEPPALVDYTPVYTIATTCPKGREKTLFGPFLNTEPLYAVEGKQGWSIYSHAPRPNDCLKATFVASWRDGRWQSTFGG